jgi:hypothetical protein
VPHCILKLQSFCLYCSMFFFQGFVHLAHKVFQLSGTLHKCVQGCDCVTGHPEQVGTFAGPRRRRTEAKMNHTFSMQLRLDHSFF